VSGHSTALALRGAKGSSAPYDAPDSLRSTQRAEIVDLLGEGQIGGLVNGLKSIYLDGVPVENADGTRNFAEFVYQLTLGGPTGETPHVFGDVQTEIGVGVTVLAAVPVVRTVADTTADAVRVTITIPQLTQQQPNGDRVGASVEYKIEAQSAGGGYQPRWTETITGKATSPYSRAVIIPLTDLGPAPWDIRLTRITADSASSDLVNALAWSSYTVISGVKMLYRNSAVARIVFDAKNFSSIPSRWYDVMGVSDWDIPVNYDPRARTVAGSWNGTFKQDWTNNPAWVVYNLVQHPRYGLGQYVAQLPDKWTLYQLALWCDAPLPDGRGGTEPRYSVNAVILEQSEALRLLQEICSVFRGVLMHGGATLTVTWDAPGTPVASYAPANVVDGLFTYADGSSAAKKTSCTCWYTDRSQAARRIPVTWDDNDLVAKYGLRNFEINPIGVATPGQALRMAKWALYTSHYEEQTVSFRVGAEGPVRRLGEIFQVTDPAETGERLGGRLQAATTTAVTLDAPVTLVGGETYTLWVTQPHATDPARLVTEGRTVTTSAGTTAALTVSPAFSAAPVVGTVWLLEGSNVAPTLWRYVAITETRGENGGVEYDVLGVRHEPGKFDLIEANQPLTPRPTRRLPYGAPPVASITITETVYFDGQGNAHARVTVSWPMPAQGLRYVLTWRVDNGPWSTLPPTSANTLDFDDLQPGVYEVQVQSLNALGQISLPTTATAILVGDQSRPDDVAGLAYQIVPGGLRLSWQPDTQPGYSRTRLSYGATFGTSVFFWEGASTDFVVVPPADGTYMVWAVHVNRRDVPSLVPASIEVPYVALATEPETVYVEYSVDGATLWHTTFTTGDLFARWKVGVAGAWQGPFRIVGETGAGGDYVDFIFRRSATQPATPTGDNPALWFDAPPAANGDPLWASTGTKTAAGVLVGVWSTPVQIEGAAGAPGTAYWLLASAGAVTKSIANTFTPSVLTLQGVSQSGAGAPVLYAGRFTIALSTDGSTYGADVYTSAGDETSTTYTVTGSTTKLIRVRLWQAGGTTAGLDEMVIPIVSDGAAGSAGLDGLTFVFPNASHTLPADNSGNVTSYGGSGSTLQVYEGSTPLIYNTSLGLGNGRFVPGTPTVSPAASITVGSFSGAGSTTLTMGQHAGASAAQDVIQVTIPLTIRRLNGTDVTASVTQTLSKSKQGAPGSTGGTGQTGQSNHRVYKAVTIGSPPATPGNTTSGATPAGWSATPLTLTSGQEQYQSDGTTPAGSTTTTWSTPYPSYLKVGSLSAITANLGSVTAGSITGTATINITGSAKFDGVNSAISIPDPFNSPSTLSRTIATIVNSGGSSQIGLYGVSTTSGSWGVYGYNSSAGAGSSGVQGFGYYGVRGVSSAAGAGVYGGTTGTSGSSGVHGDAGGTGSWAVTAKADGFGQGGDALRVLGRAQFSDRITSTLSGNVVPIVLPVVSAKPAAIAGGVCIHNTLGLIFSDGTSWYGPSGGIVVV
jgi:hypothetical protein